ncbi:MAG: NADH-quinone oxidoreductase subunit D [Candidatus Odinarchaeota archaeon]|nr:NADH-quinone oxidoreductase subunit D [Candidatus Odinarchaeota archaeon]
MNTIKRVIEPIKEGIKNLTHKAITFNFPPSGNLTKRFRGRHIFYPDKCIGCQLCAKICPNNAITMVDRERDGKKVKFPQIDYEKCCFCGLCVDICPKQALRFTNYPFILAMEKSKLVLSPEELSKEPKFEPPNPPPIKNVSQWALSRSIWVLYYMTGCCFIEAVPWVSSAFDMERFGLITVASPRHADVLIIGGYVTKKTLKNIIMIYKQMTEPKFVLVFGNCPMSGGTYWDSYNTIKDIEKYIPVDVWIAGCPPRPENIGLAIMEVIYAIQSGYRGKKPEVRRKEVDVFPKENIRDEKYFEYTPFGPVHPATGNFSVRLKIDSEIISDAIPNPGYLHRGFERLMEYRTWWQNIMIVQRICVLDGASYELGYIGAVEKLGNIDAPKRAKFLRVIQSELSRIQSHLLNLGFIAKASGLDTLARITWGDREKILYLLEKMTGGRIYQLYSIPGGVRRDIKPDFKDRCHDIMKYMKGRLRDYDALLTENEVFVDRTKGVGIIDKEDILKYDLTGPNARGSGMDTDIRKDLPYEAYDEIEFNVISENKCDALSRTIVRRNEIEESLHIIEEALDKIPNGPIKAKKTSDGKSITPFMRMPKGESIHFVESARGELMFHVVSDGGNKPYRVKIRGPTFDTILVYFPKLLKGTYIADMPVIYWSLDNCPADHDR